MAEQELQDWEYPDADDAGDLAETIACPSCGEAIYEDAEQCPSCGDYVTSRSTLVLADRPWWFVLLAVAGSVALVVWLLVG